MPGRYEDTVFTTTMLIERCDEGGDITNSGCVGERELGEYMCKGLLVRAMVFNTQKPLNPNSETLNHKYFRKGLLVRVLGYSTLEILNPKHDSNSAGFGGEAWRG
jgi:hypothetical protein